MFNPVKGFSGFTTNDIGATKEFYTNALGLQVMSEEMGLTLAVPGGGQLFIYEKENHQPAAFTIFNLVVTDIDAAVEALRGKGVEFEHYGFEGQDDSGVMRGLAHQQGPDIAWFKDPAGNILAVLQDK